MKFIMSFSAGKDSTFALHKMIEEGHEPVGLLVMINKEQERTWFHGVPLDMLEDIAEALEIPLILCRSEGEDYHLVMEERLKKAKIEGAEAVCFGDIDIEQHREWCTSRAEAANLEVFFPLWHADRAGNTYSIVNSGYKCVLKTIHNDLIPKEVLGKPMDLNMIEIFKECGIDLCGEDGEYHTVVVDGPIFKRPVKYKMNKILDRGHISTADIELVK